MPSDLCNTLKLTAWCSLALTINFLVSHAHAATVTVKNNCNFDIWPAFVSHPATPTRPNPDLHDGWEMKKGSAPREIVIPSEFHARFWARTLCDNNAFGSGKPACEVGDCKGLLDW
jgi:hypothetical protein